MKVLPKEFSLNVCCECMLCCCQDAKPPLTAARVKTIKAYLKKNGFNSLRPFSNLGYTFANLDESGFCVFYDKRTKRCQVHDVKPETCLAGPITFDINCRTGKVEWFLKTAEICALAGKIQEDPDRFKKHFDTARQQIMELIRHLDAGSLRTILRIEEPQTFKIGEDVWPDEVAEKLR